MSILRGIVFILLATFTVNYPVYAQLSPLFPRPAELQPDIRFWTRIYTEVDTRGGLIHDAKHLGIVYQVIRFPSGYKGRARERYVEKVKKRYKKILRTLAKGKRKGLSRKEKRVLALWPKNVSNRQLRAARKRLRFQLGQANHFRKGLIRSGMWKDFIHKTFTEMGLPGELGALPHVESSFNPKAHSHVGAAGLWQFTRSTGRRFLRIDHVVDERLDPYAATVAAARLFKHNYSVTGTWPLALTAYNHGAAGMRRAVRKMKTRNIVPILRRYRSRTFGFASRNFYVAFLAALDVDRNVNKHFGPLQLNKPQEMDVVKIRDYMTADTLQRALGVTRKTIRKHNPALLLPAWNGSKYVPKGYQLYLPHKVGRQPARLLLAKIPASKRFKRQRPDVSYRVRRGNTLSQIATRFGVSVRELVAFNNLRSRHRIRVGQLLRLPQAAGATTKIALKDKRSPRVKPKKILQDKLYRVRPGDTVRKIARRFNIKERKLLAYNDLRNKNRIFVGQTLRLPQAGVTTMVALKHKRSFKLKTQKIPEDQLYRIRPGDTIRKIARRFNIKERKLLAYNDLRNKNRIYVGQTLRLTADAAKTIVSTPQPTKKIVVALAPPAPARTNATEQTDATTAKASEPIAQGVLPADLPPSLSADSSGGVADAPVEPDASPAAETESVVQGGLPLEASPFLSADPSDYSVAGNHTIEVQAAETLGHYAEWLQLRASRLRRLNKMRYRKPVVIGKRLRLDFSRVTPEVFERQRLAYHHELQEEFFEQFQIKGTQTHRVRRGESLWNLAKRKYEVPVWLLRQYNPDLDFGSIKSGIRITIPLLERRARISSGQNRAPT